MARKKGAGRETTARAEGAAPIFIAWVKIKELQAGHEKPARRGKQLLKESVLLSMTRSVPKSDCGCFFLLPSRDTSCFIFQGGSVSVLFVEFPVVMSLTCVSLLSSLPFSEIGNQNTLEERVEQPLDRETAEKAEGDGGAEKGGGDVAGGGVERRRR